MKKLRILLSLLILPVMFLQYGSALAGDSAFADDLDGVYVKTFTISAYYSPLPCQDRYAMGSYEADIRMNGRGTNGADGTPVYPGMVAAPKSYAFGTKMNIPGIGNVAVHDRGGAILTYDGSNGVYDRLDIWMGYGDVGLRRALNWGKRNVNVTVYGLNSAISEEVNLLGFSAAEAVVDCPSVPVANSVVDSVTDVVSVESAIVENTVVDGVSNVSTDVTAVDVKPLTVSIDEVDFDSFDEVLYLGYSGKEVEKLQMELKSLNFYRAEVDGEYDEVTQHAVFKFQQSQGLLTESEEYGAGVFGPKTRRIVNSILENRTRTNGLIAVYTSQYADSHSAKFNAVTELLASDDDYIAAAFVNEMQYGLVDEKVRALQEVLFEDGVFDHDVTGYYGAVTKSSVLEFQLKHGLIDSADDIGAGRVGPATLKLLNEITTG